MLRAAIVGLGSWGRELVASVHGSELLRYTAACTRSPAKAEAYCSIAAARNYRLAAYGSRGYAEVIKPTMETFRFIPAVQGRASHLAAIPEPETVETAGVNSVRAELETFARCVAERRQPIPFEDVLHGVAIFEAAVESARTGRPAAIDGGNR